MGTARRTLAFLGLAAVATICIALAFVVLALTTAPGARWTLRFADELVPSELSAGTIDGSWLFGLALRDVLYVDDSVRAEIDLLEVAPELAALGRGRLELARLDVDGGRVLLAGGDTPQAAVSGPPTLPAITPRIGVRELRVANVEIAAADTTIGIVRATGALNGPELRLDELELAVADIGLRGSALAALTADGAQASLDARLQAQPADAAWQADIVAHATFRTASEPWTVAIEWSRLALRGGAVGELVSPSGRLVVTPGTEPAAGTLTARIEGARLPDAVQLAAAAAYDDGTLDLRALGVTALGGDVLARGAVDVADRSGVLQVAAHALDPARIDARLGGDIGGNVNIELAAEPTLRVGATGALAGALNGHALEGTLRGHYADGALELERADLRVDDGRVEAAGTIGRAAVQLTFAADLPDVGAWYPPASGTVTATGEVRGAPRDPTVHAELAARDLALDGIGLPRLDALGLALDGTLAAHAIELRSTSASGTFGARVDQGWDGRVVRGIVHDSTLAVVRADTWTLDAPAGYSVGPDGGEAGPLCYSGERTGKLCATLRDRQLAVTATQIPSQLAAPWLPRDVALAGAADAEVALDWRGTPRGTLSLDQSTLTIDLPGEAAQGDGSPVVEVTDLALRAGLDETRFHASLAASLGGATDRIEGSLDLQPPSADGALTGRLTAAFTNLALIEAFVPGVGDIRGRVAFDVDVGGSPVEPRVAAELRADSLQAAVPVLGIDVTDGSLAARADSLDDPLIEIDGQVCSVGCATFTGRAQRPAEQPWSLAAALAGERIAVADLPHLRAAVTPNLALSASEGLWRLSGSVDVADAALKIVNPPRAAVRPAPETVVYGREADTRAVDRAPGSLVLDVQARLGDVSFEGLGVTAELDGTLGLQRRAGGPLLAQGSTSVETGSFRAYGQELAIERGLLIFTGSLDDPTLDIRATRNVEGSRVGLSISGTARNPRSEVFSDAALNDSEAFARLVTGHSLASAGAADAETLERAAIGLGLSRVLPSLDRVGANLGLSEFGFAAGNGETDGGLLVAGRQVGNDFLLRYKRGLFDDFSSLELIYRITDRLRLHTESGSAQSIDLIYEVDPTVVVPALRDLARGRPSSGAEPAEPAEPANVEP